MVAAVVAFVIWLVISLTFSVVVSQGEEAVLIDKPLIFGHGGVQSNPVTTGRSYIWPTTSYVLVDKKPQQFTEHFDDLMSSDGVPLKFDAALRLIVLDSVALVQKFGEKWYENNVEVEFRNRVRQAVRKHGMNETAISTVAIDDEVTDAMSGYLVKAGIPVKLVKVTIGKANPPDAVKDQRIETAKQEQRKNTEDKRKLAEDARKDAETSRAKADEAYLKELNLNSEQFVMLETIKMQREVCGRSESNCTFVLGGNNAGVMVNAAQAKKTESAAETKTK